MKIVLFLLSSTVYISGVYAQICTEPENSCGIPVGENVLVKDYSFTSTGDLTEGNHGVQAVEWKDLPQPGVLEDAEIVFEGNIWCNWIRDSRFTPDSLRLQFVGHVDPIVSVYNGASVALEIGFNQTKNVIQTRYENWDHTWEPYIEYEWQGDSRIAWFTYDEFISLDATSKPVTNLKFIRRNTFIELTIDGAQSKIILPLNHDTQLNDVWKIQMMCGRRETSSVYVKNFPGVDIPLPTTTTTTTTPFIASEITGLTDSTDEDSTTSSTDFLTTSEEGGPILAARAGPTIFPIFLGTAGALGAAAGAAAIAFWAIPKSSKDNTDTVEEDSAPSEILTSDASELDWSVEDEDNEVDYINLDENVYSPQGHNKQNRASTHYIDIDPDNSFWVTK